MRADRGGAVRQRGLTKASKLHVADRRVEATVEERAMKRDHLECALDLRRADLDPELLAAPLTVQHASRIMIYGGNESECPYDHSALRPRHMERFLDPAVKVAQAIKHFEHDWRSLHRILSGVRRALERGQVLFRRGLERATAIPEKVEYLSLIDFAFDGCASIAARNTYPILVNGDISIDKC